MTDASMQQLSQTLKKRGLSLTTARITVLSALQYEEPQTMRQVIARCKDIDRASVYRTIALYENMGIVQRMQVGWKYQLELTGDFHEHHHHASCLSCGQIIPLPEDIALENRLKLVAKTHDFDLQTHQLELRGLCAQCVAKQKGAV